MSDKNYNRRKFLSLIAASGSVASLGAVSGVSSAENTTVSSSEITNIIESKHVENILSEFDGIPLQKEDASKTVVTPPEDESTYEVIQIPASIGEVVHFTKKGSEETVEEALLQLGGAFRRSPDIGDTPRKSSEYLPTQYRNLPQNVSGIFASGSGGQGWFRSTTLEETTTLKNIVGAGEEDDIVSFSSSATGGYSVIIHPNDDNKEASHYKVGPESDGNRSINVSSTTQNSSIAFSELSSDEIRQLDVISGKNRIVTQKKGLQACISICGTCATAVTSCGRCALYCAGSISGVLAIACAVCLVLSCNAGGFGCAQCYDQCRHHVPYV